MQILFDTVYSENTSIDEEQPIEMLCPPLLDFFSKRITYKQFPIMAAAVVSDAALLVAYQYISDMLSNTPEILQNLLYRQAEFHIIGRHQKTSDLPEHRKRKGKPFQSRKGKRPWTIDSRTRGVGGKFSSCGEENLLQLARDRYAGHNICVHEFAHAVMLCGLDDTIRELLTRQYRSSRRKNLWSGMYAGTNTHEFFAELSSWYFGGRGDVGTLSPPPKPGRAWLKQYDPQAYELLRQIYSGELQPAILSSKIELNPA